MSLLSTLLVYLTIIGIYEKQSIRKVPDQDKNKKTAPEVGGGRTFSY